MARIISTHIWQTVHITGILISPRITEDTSPSRLLTRQRENRETKERKKKRGEDFFRLAM